MEEGTTREGASNPGTTQTDLNNTLCFRDWQECRATIGRLDTILADLRKNSFAFITGLTAAAAYASYFAQPTPPDPAQASPGTPAAAAAAAAALVSLQARALIIVVIMILIAAAFVIDNYYNCLLDAAVERALDVECLTGIDGLRITKYITINAVESRSYNMIQYLYGIHLLALLLIGWGMLGFDNPLSLPTSIIFLVFLLLAGIMLLYYSRVHRHSRPNQHKDRTWAPGEGKLDKKSSTTITSASDER